jgi:eukaryotic-like serine/threonine-protein kinase
MPQPGQKLGRYLILEGGEPGVFHPAYDTRLDRKVALHALPRGAGDAAAALARIAHPNLAAVHDVGKLDLDGGWPYLSTELDPGDDLATWLARQPRRPREIVRVMVAAARGLAAAHAAAVTHGALGAQDIRVDGARVLVTGFRLAAPVDRAEDGRAFATVLAEALRRATPSAPARLHRLAARGMASDPAQRPADLDAFAGELAADPAIRWRNRGLAVGAAAALVAAFWGGGYLRANPERRCRSGAEAIAGAWNPARRAALRQRYAAAGKAESWPVLERRLDGFEGAWRAMYADTCAASYRRRAQSDAAFDLRVQCLGAQRVTLDAFVGTLAGGVAPALQLVQAAGAELPQVSDCGGGAPGARSLPSDPGRRAQIAAVEEAVAISHAEQLVGDFRRAAATAGKAIDAARSLGYEPLLASALIRLASVEMITGSNAAGQGRTALDRASERFEDAYAVAESGRDDRQRLAAASEQVMVSLRRGDFGEAALWADLAHALLARLDRPAAESAILAMNVGWMKLLQGETRAAAVDFQRAVDASGKTVPPDPRRTASALGALCTTKAEAQEQIACFRKALAMARAAYGPEHPELGRFYNNLANALSQEPASHAESCQVMRTAIAVQEGTLEPANPVMITALTNLANCLREEEKIPEARRTYEDAIARKPGPSDRAFLYEQYGVLIGNYFSVAEAVPYFRQAVADYAEMLGPANDRTLRARIYLAQTLRDLGPLGPAERELDDAIALSRRERVVSHDVADLLAHRGWLMVTRGSLDGAAALFREAMSVDERAETPEIERDLPIYGLGVVELRRGRPAQAIPLLEKALELRPLDRVFNEEMRAETAFDLARALALAGRANHARACALAAEAMGIFRPSVKLQQRARLREAERWAARQRCPRR